MDFINFLASNGECGKSEWDFGSVLNLVIGIVFLLIPHAVSYSNKKEEHKGCTECPYDYSDCIFMD